MSVFSKITFFYQWLFRFGRNETEKTCRVVIIDDSLYEDNETFNVTLTSPMGGRLGNFSSSEIVISADVNDGKSHDKLKIWVCLNFKLLLMQSLVVFQNNIGRRLHIFSIVFFLASWKKDADLRICDCFSHMIILFEWVFFLEQLSGKSII